MTKTRRVRRGDNGKYKINGKSFDQLVGSRAQVWHETAYKTTGGLTRYDLLKNKHGNIVSLSKHRSEKRIKRLEKAGYKPKKGVFVLMRKNNRNTRSKRRNSRTKRRRR